MSANAQTDNRNCVPPLVKSHLPSPTDALIIIKCRHTSGEATVEQMESTSYQRNAGEPQIILDLRGFSLESHMQNQGCKQKTIFPVSEEFGRYRSHLGISVDARGQTLGFAV